MLTGASGFIGSRLLPALLADGHHVLVVRRRGGNAAAAEQGPRTATLVDTGDAGELASAVKEWRPSVCVNLATRMAGGATPGESAELLESNVAFPARVIEALFAAGGGRVVNASSFMQRRGGQRLQAVNAYAVSKNLFGLWLEHFSATRGLQVVDVQLFDTVGPRDPRGKVWRACAQAAASQVSLRATPGGQLVSLTHVNDVVDAFRILVRLQASTALWTDHHLPGPQTVTFREAVSLFSQAIGVEIPVEWGARPYSDAAMFELWRWGTVPIWWHPKVSLREGFVELWREVLESQAGLVLPPSNAPRA